MPNPNCCERHGCSPIGTSPLSASPTNTSPACCGGTAGVSSTGALGPSSSSSKSLPLATPSVPAGTPSVSTRSLPPRPRSRLPRRRLRSERGPSPAAGSCGADPSTSAPAGGGADASVAADVASTGAAIDGPSPIGAAASSVFDAAARRLRAGLSASDASSAAAGESCGSCGCAVAVASSATAAFTARLRRTGLASVSTPASADTGDCSG